MTNYKPIAEKWRSEGERLMFQWHEGWTFHEIFAIEITVIEPWNLKLLPLVKTTGKQEGVRLRNLEDQHIFDVTEELAREVVIHAAIGLKPIEVRAYVRYPSGQDYRGRPLSFSSINPGDDWGYVTGADSPYPNPTAALEFYFTYSLDALFSFYNKDDRAHLPTLNIPMHFYQLYHLDPNNKFDAKIIGRMARHTIARTPWTFGTVKQVAKYPMSEYWKVKPVPLSKARKMGGD